MYCLSVNKSVSGTVIEKNESCEELRRSRKPINVELGMLDVGIVRR